MKKVLRYAALIALGSASLAVSAQQSMGFYVQGDVGLNNFSYEEDRFKVSNIGRDLKSAYKESEFFPRLSLGYDAGDARVAVDYTVYKGIKEQFKEGGIEANVKAKAHGVGVSAIYDIPLDSNFQPYVGARLSLNQVKASGDVTIGNQSYRFKDKETRVGFGVLGGVDYIINEQTSLDLGYRYNRLSSEVSTHEVSAGLRYYIE